MSDNDAIASDSDSDCSSSLSFHLKQSLYSISAIENTIYKYASDFFIELNESTDQFVINYKLKSESKYSPDEVESFKDLFLETLNDEVLREKIRDETKELRQMIIATTFSGILKQEKDGTSQK